MRGFVLLALAVASSAFMPEYRLSDESIHIIAQNSKTITGQSAVSKCIDQNFNFCQSRFNEVLGLNPMLDYRSGTDLFNQINALLQNSLPEIVSICNQRTAFYQCLGSTYYSCMNLFYILNKPNVDYQNAFDYTRTYSSLEFMCNAGFEEVATKWVCLRGINTLNSYKSCMQGFNETVNPSVLCPTVQNTGQCLNDAYKASCMDTGAGFFGCENFRYTFDQACYGLRCVVG